MWSQDELLQHYHAAQTFSRTGDKVHAANEYKLFLAEALRRLGNAQFQLLDNKAANKLYDEAAIFAPNDLRLMLDRASACLREGNTALARGLAEKAVSLAPQNPRAQLLLGQILFNHADYAAAKPHLEAAIVADPSPQTGYILGVTYLKLNDPQHARMLFADMRKGLGESVELEILISRAYEEVGDWRKAIQQLSAAIGRRPKAPQLHYFLGLAYATRAAEGDVSLAIEQFRAELQISPQDVRSHYMLGSELLRRHELNEAEGALKQAAALEPNSPDAFIDLAELYQESHHLPEAESAARKAIELTTDESHDDFQIGRAHHLLGRILLQMGHQEEGEKEMTLSQQLNNKRLEWQRSRQVGTFKPANVEPQNSTLGAEEQAKLRASMDALKPPIADAYNNLGIAAAGESNYPAAAQYFQNAAEWNPQLETVDRNWGMAEFYARQYSAAVSPLERHLATHSDDTRARAALGLSYFTVENYAKTLSTLQPIESIVQSDPGLASAYGVSLVKAGQFDRGMNLLKTVVQQNPESAEIHGLLGGAYADQGIYTPAIEEYHKSLTLDPSQGNIHFLLGLALIRQGKPAEAIPEMRAALKANSSDTPAKYHLAFALLQTEQKPEAKQLLKEVLQQDPKYADAYYQLGKLQLENGDTRGAIENLEAGSKLSPGSDYIHYQLAMAYRRAADPDAATREMKAYEALKSRRQPK